MKQTLLHYVLPNMIMSSIFFQFHYDDGSIRPFDADAASLTEVSPLEVSPVVIDGLFDIFELSDQELQSVGLTSDAFRSPFMLEYRQIAQADGEPVMGIGAEPNIYFESVTLETEPIHLRAWAHAWSSALARMDEVQRQQVMPYSWMHAEELLNDLNQLTRQADCAIRHRLGIVLFIAW